MNQNLKKRLRLIGTTLLVSRVSVLLVTPPGSNVANMTTNLKLPFQQSVLLSHTTQPE